jgi:hypothetical protein
MTFLPSILKKEIMIRNNKHVALVLLISILTATTSFGQQKIDSLIINVGKSKIIFLINDKADLDLLENYDLNAILKNLKLKINGDSTLVNERGNKSIVTDTTINLRKNSEDKRVLENESETTDDWRNDDDNGNSEEKGRINKIRHVFNLDLGTNNFINSNGDFPSSNNELYTVRPWGSWYFAINSIYKTPIKGRFYLEWGPGISWYNFKFENDRTRITETGDQTIFIEDPDLSVKYKKSKLTASYINLTAVPMFSFGKEKSNTRKYSNWKDLKSGHEDAGFRIGLGGYAGYRLGSHAKVKYSGGDKDKDRDNFNLNNFRYGLRLQMGFRGTDLFFNYDINELFADGNGPKLNAFSFGIIL